MTKNNFAFILLLTTQLLLAQKNVFEISRTGNLEDIKTIFEADNKSIEEKGEKGYTPLILACYRNNIAVAQFLIEHTTDINYNPGLGTALSATVLRNNIELTKALLVRNADPNIQDINKQTALHFAVINENIEIVKLLLKYKANKKMKDSQGLTPIDYAKQMGNKKIKDLIVRFSTVKS